MQIDARLNSYGKKEMITIGNLITSLSFSSGIPARPDLFSLYAGDISANGLLDPATVTASAGVVSSVGATGSYGLTFTSQGTGADILAVPGGLQFQNGKYLLANISRTIRRAQIGIEYTLLENSAATAYPVEIERAAKSTRARLQIVNGAGAGYVRLRGPDDQVAPGELISFYAARETMGFEIDLLAATMTVVAADNWQTVTPIAVPPASLPGVEIRIGAGCNMIIHKLAVMETL